MIYWSKAATVQIGAILLDAWAMRCLGRNWSGAVTIKFGHELVRTGPDRLVRQPIFTPLRYGQGLRFGRSSPDEFRPRDDSPQDSFLVTR